jgi:hypothetical protein
MLGVGIATIITGAAIGGLAQQQHDASVASGTSQVDAQAADDASRRYALGANVALPLGSVLAVAGLVWVTIAEVRHRRSRRDSRAQMSTGALVSW